MKCLEFGRLKPIGTCVYVYTGHILRFVAPPLIHVLIDRKFNGIEEHIFSPNSRQVHIYTIRTPSLSPLVLICCNCFKPSTYFEHFIDSSQSWSRDQKHAEIIIQQILFATQSIFRKLLLGILQPIFCRPSTFSGTVKFRTSSASFHRSIYLSIYLFIYPSKATIHQKEQQHQQQGELGISGH